LIVEGEVVVEVKSVLHFEPVFVAQMLTYLRITGLRRGLLLNFNKAVLKTGVKRISLSYPVTAFRNAVSVSLVSSVVNVLNQSVKLRLGTTVSGSAESR
jgi:PD-(D/E)XK nuclease superfamily protein